MEVVDHEHEPGVAVDEVVHDGCDRVVTEVGIGIEEVECVVAEARVYGSERGDERGPEVEGVGIGDVARHPRDLACRLRPSPFGQRDALARAGKAGDEGDREVGDRAVELSHETGPRDVGRPELGHGELGSRREPPEIQGRNTPKSPSIG